jgi:hypothetical protein
MNCHRMILEEPGDGDIIISLISWKCHYWNTDYVNLINNAAELTFKPSKNK